MATSNRTGGITTDNPDLDTIRQDLASLKTDFTSLMSDLAAGGKHAAQKGADSLKDTARNAADHVKSFQDTTCETVKSHPMASILVAAGIGAIAARILMKGGR